MSYATLDKHLFFSPFLDPAAVDAWDEWFRLRENGELRDVSIESTWQRVAHALATVEGNAAAQWSRRYFDAQAHWLIVFDERVLATAGTSRPDWPSDPVAVLDLPSFVVGAFGANARFDGDGLRASAELAVRCLDNVALLRADGECRPRVSVIGLADALAMLGLRYDSAAAREQAAAIARILAEGCLAGSVRLARERGAGAAADAQLLATLRARGMPDELIDAAARFGLRHAHLTAIHSQRRLALFANNVADALDPLECASGGRWTSTSSGPRFVHPKSYAATVARLVCMQGESAFSKASPPQTVTAAAQHDLRNAMQPWIDAPIDYPLCENIAATNTRRPPG
jgi:ribonucleoside-diphosphate reductase alpha chain